MLYEVITPGYQVPFAGREMSLPYGWGTGGIQVTASVIGAGISCVITSYSIHYTKLYDFVLHEFCIYRGLRRG